MTASNTADGYTFGGMLRDSTGSNESIGGASGVTVEGTSGTTPTTPTTPVPSNPGATRSLPTVPVAPGSEFTVTIAANYGAFGRVVETLPDGFSYVEDSVSPDSVRVAVVSQEVSFTLLGEESFSYKVMASRTGGSHTFGGSLSDDEGVEYPIGGTSMVTVDAPVLTATRVLPSRVSPGGTLTVDIMVMNYGAFGRVEETLPDGFSYVEDSISPDSVRVAVVGQEVAFTLLGEESFSYDVIAPNGTGSYNFSGMLGDSEGMEHVIGGASRITVGTTMPGPSDDTCLETLLVDGVSGEWSSSCESTARVGSYARYYSFMLTEESEVTISLESSTDTYLYLRAGEVTSGTAVHENDDVAPGTDTNSRIQAMLGAGIYTIEATTYSAGQPGSFTLTVSGLGGGTTMPGPSDDTCLETLLVDGVSGEWSSSCESTARVGSYARYYSFMLTEESEVTISLESSTDTYLYLRAGEVTSGTAVHENDDVAPGTDTNSRIQAMLGAGIYTIEATTYSAGQPGSFTLTVSGLGGGTTMPGPSDDTCLETLLVDGVSGEWSSSCESTARVGSYARYYSFMLTEESEVTISLESSTDTYLYLRAGEVTSGTAVHENDDVAPGTDTNSRIQAMLGAGIYTIEATTYSAGQPGSFTLTVSGLGGGTTMPGPSDDTCLETLLVDGVSGEWSSSCESTARVGSYARYYSFMLTEESEVTISLESSTDTYLYLRAGEVTSGTAVHENDDVAPGTDTNSRIQAMLGAGIYTIEATTYSAGQPGSFTLTVGGL